MGGQNVFVNIKDDMQLKNILLIMDIQNLTKLFMKYLKRKII